MSNSDLPDAPPQSDPHSIWVKMPSGQLRHEWKETIRAIAADIELLRMCPNEAIDPQRVFRAVRLRTDRLAELAKLMNFQ